MPLDISKEGTGISATRWLDYFLIFGLLKKLKICSLTLVGNVRNPLCVFSNGHPRPLFHLFLFSSRNDVEKTVDFGGIQPLVCQSRRRAS